MEYNLHNRGCFIMMENIEYLTEEDIDSIVEDLQRTITVTSGVIQVLKKRKERIRIDREKADWDKTYRRILSDEIDTWENWDNRMGCPLFDMCEIGCLFCDHYDMIMDTQSLSCHLEVDLHRKKVNEQ